MTNARSILLALALIAIGGSIFYFESLKPKRADVSGEAEIPLAPALPPSAEETTSGMPTPPQTVKNYPRAKEIVNPSGFINTEGITVKELIGKKVILIDFWTYSCINCQRTTPYLNAWYQKYSANGGSASGGKDQGLEIIGVHTPEFEFERKYENVLAAVKKFGIEYPVVLDNDYATWTAYGNRYWPRKYLIDIDGYIVYDHIGEGAYDETERKIQELLGERVARLNLGKEIVKDIANPTGTISVDFFKVGSPEVYFGAARNQLLGNGTQGAIGMQSLSLPTTIERNVLYLGGDWNIANEYAESRSVNAKIVFRYNAKSVYLVASAEQEVKIMVLKDGKPLGIEASDDTALYGNSTARVREERLYKLVNDPQGYGEHTLEIIIESPRLRAFTFTFG